VGCAYDVGAFGQGDGVGPAPTLGVVRLDAAHLSTCQPLSVKHGNVLHMEATNPADGQPIDLTLEIDEPTHVDTVFVGFETTDGDRHVLFRVSPPASVSVYGSVPNGGHG